jgi:hypothetical protein
MPNLVGSKSNQISTNQMLGDCAFMNKESVVIKPKTTAAPLGVGDMCFELTSNTELKVKVKGSDGTVRSVSLTLA